MAETKRGTLAAAAQPATKQVPIGSAWGVLAGACGRIGLVPTISRFYGIVIAMYFE